MTIHAIPLARKSAQSLKAGCRYLLRPLMPFVPDGLASIFPFLGRVRVHGPHSLTLRLLTYGPAGKDRIALKLARRGFWSYEGETTRVYLALLGEARCVIDIGANTGLFALMAAKANVHCRVWAFEPVPAIFDMLRANIRLNNLTNLEAFPVAISDSTGDCTFFVTKTGGGIPLDSSARAGFRDDVQEVRVPTATLDDHVHQHHLDRLDLLKIDAEATEIKVIRGARQTIEKHRPYIICEVLDDLDHTELQQLMTNLDYRFVHITPQGLERRLTLKGSLAVDHRNHLFVPAEKADQLERVCQSAAIPILP